MKKAFICLLTFLLFVSGCSSSEEHTEEVDAFSVKINSLQVGDTITFGEYEQDNNRSNGKEPIEWIVLDKQDGRALVISKYGLEEMRYNSSDKAVTWEKSAVRDWLNYHFFDDAFTEEEQEYIAKTTVKADSNPDYYYTEQGYDTEDRVFLLSIQEAKRYFSSASDRRAPVTQYALSEDAGVTSGYCYWWLRTMGSNAVSAALVWYDGRIVTDGDFVYDDTYVVRPALWLQSFESEKEGAEQSEKAVSVACSNVSIDDSKDDEVSFEGDGFVITVTDCWSDSGRVGIDYEYPGLIIHQEQTGAFNTEIFPECETNTMKYLYNQILQLKNANSETRKITIEEGKPFKVNEMSVRYFTAYLDTKKGHVYDDGSVEDKDYFIKHLYGAVPINDDKILVVYLGCYWFPDEECEYTVDEDSLRDIFEHINITVHDS